MSKRRHRDDPAARRGLLDFRQEQQGQQEVPEVVALKLTLVAVLGLFMGAHHHAGIVDQQVDLALVLDQPFGALPDARQARQVELVNYDLARTALVLLPVRPFVQDFGYDIFTISVGVACNDQAGWFSIHNVFIRKSFLIKLSASCALRSHSLIFK